jgi:NADPH:quinone reductase-like Zn-dependent oxidoreductase
VIVGAGGGVGTAAVQIAKALGAEVTGVDDGSKLGRIRSLGADHVLDHTRDDFTATGARYDLVLDIAGTRPFSEVRAAISADGSYVLIGHDHYGRYGRRRIGSLGRFLRLLVRSPFDRRLPGLRGASDPGDRLGLVKRLIDEGRFAPVVDRTFPLAEVPAAIRALEEGSVVGRIVISI